MKFYIRDSYSNLMVGRSSNSLEAATKEALKFAQAEPDRSFEVLLVVGEAKAVRPAEFTPLVELPKEIVAQPATEDPTEDEYED